MPDTCTSHGNDCVELCTGIMPAHDGHAVLLLAQACTVRVKVSPHTCCQCQSRLVAATASALQSLPIQFRIEAHPTVGTVLTVHVKHHTTMSNGPYKIPAHACAYAKMPRVALETARCFHCAVVAPYLHDLCEVPVVLTAQHHVSKGVHVAGIKPCHRHKESIAMLTAMHNVAKPLGLYKHGQRNVVQPQSQVSQPTIN